MYIKLQEKQKSFYEKELNEYTPMSQQEILLKVELINVQLIDKNKKNDKKEVIIGTPVILNEY